MGQSPVAEVGSREILCKLLRVLLLGRKHQVINSTSQKVGRLEVYSNEQILKTKLEAVRSEYSHNREHL